MGIRRTIPHKVKPSYPVGIDWSNPLSKGLVSAYLGDEYVQGRPSGLIAKSGTVTKQADFINVDEAAYIDFDSNVSGATELTVITLVRRNSGSGYGSFVGTETTYNASFLFGVESGAATQFIINSNWAPSGTLGAAVFATRAVTYNGGSFQRIYLNGELDAETTTTVPASINSHTTIRIGKNGGYGEDLDVKYTYIFNKALSHAEIKELTDNPYQILQPRTQYIPIAAEVLAAINGGMLSSKIMRRRMRRGRHG